MVENVAQSSLSVVVSVRVTCATAERTPPSELPVGLIVGVSVGGVAAGVLLALGVVLATRVIRARRQHELHEHLLSKAVAQTR